MATYNNKLLCPDCMINRHRKIFFPGQKSKCDIAQMIFYMELWYEEERENGEVCSVTPDLRAELELQGEDHEDLSHSILTKDLALKL